MANPVLVNTIRGGHVESRHRGAIAVCDARGRVVHSWGDIDYPVFPRSAIKTLQALPLVETGAADHFDLSPAELALACASHGGEAEHTETVAGLLSRIGLGVDDLECGPHMPYHEPTAAQLIRAGIEPGRVHNNCSGKHGGMLATARFCGEETRGYTEPDHPSQRRWIDTLGELADIDSARLPASRDGCGIPVIAVPLGAMATAFARVAAPDDLSAARGDALARIVDAIAAHPYMVAGSGRLCTEVMQLTGKRLLLKTGAEGVFTAILPAQGLGVALKIDDGNTAAAEVAVLHLLERLGALTRDDRAALDERLRIPIRNTRGLLTGHRAAAADW